MTHDDEVWILASILRAGDPTSGALSAERYAAEIIDTRDEENRGIEHVLLTPLSQVFS